MRVRHGINVQYSHDDEALISELLTWREFAYADAGMLAYWLNALRPYSYCAAYYTGASDDYGYVPVNSFYPWHRLEAERNGVTVIEVDLWKCRDTGRQLLYDHGFSCLICGARTAMKMRGHVPYHDPMWDLVRGRQSASAPELVCQECAIDIPAMLSPWITPRRMNAAVDRLVRRAQPLRSMESSVRRVSFEARHARR